MKSIQIFNTYDMILLEVNHSVYLSTCNFFPQQILHCTHWFSEDSYDDQFPGG